MSKTAKRKPGAPRKGEDKAKAELIQLRVNVGEKQAFTDAADLDGKKITLEFAKDAFTIDFDGMAFKGTVKVDPKQKPKEKEKA